MAADDGVAKARWQTAAIDQLKASTTPFMLDLPVPGAGELNLELKRFDVLAPDVQFLRATADGQTAVAAPNVVLLRGKVAGDPQSHVFLALSRSGLAAGYVRSALQGDYHIATDLQAPRNGVDAEVVIERRVVDDLPDFPTFCGVDDAVTPPLQAVQGFGAGSAQKGVSVATVAIDADQAYVGLFGGDVAAAEAYIVQVIGAVSDIYIRDFNVKLILSFVRTWPSGGEPFNASNLSGFRNYWMNNEDTTDLNLVHLFSGRRDLGYGGIAYVTGVCNGVGYAISGYMLGGFPTPIRLSHLDNWDLVVVAHEMGHNMGTLHTHDGYSPPIDQCGNGVWSRGTIMSYCHITPGGLLNTDLRFHARVQAVVRNDVLTGCLWHDCNDNDIPDADDLSGATSIDSNSNGVPDECEDCNGNAILDPAEVMGGTAADVDANGTLDVCEADCNGNALPDAFETTLTPAIDADGNLMPDSCQPDCNGNGVFDYTDIAAGTSLDLDRDAAPDECQDCNSNGTTDWMDLDRQHHVFVVDGGGTVREYHGASGVNVRNLAAGLITQPYDAVFGPDNRLYVSSFDQDAVYAVDVDAGTAAIFIASGSGGLDGPTGLAFGGDGFLYVADSGNSQVLKFAAGTGAPRGTFVLSGAGGLSSPQAMVFGPNGNLFVADAANQVHEYDAGSGAHVGIFVPTNAAGFMGPRGMAFLPDGRLLVTSHDNDAIFAYDASGALLGKFNDLYSPLNVWSVRVGATGNVFAARDTGSEVRVVEYDLATGRYVRSFIRGDNALIAPRPFAFRGPSADDSNQNGVLDTCEALLCCCGDLDCDGDVDGADFDIMGPCVSGALQTMPPAGCNPFDFANADLDSDGDVDLQDIKQFLLLFYVP